MFDDAELDKRFTYHPPPGPEEIAAYVEIRKRAREFAGFLRDTVAPSRELALSLTHLEEAVMSANAGIARRGLASNTTNDEG